MEGPDRRDLLELGWLSLRCGGSFQKWKMYFEVFQESNGSLRRWGCIGLLFSMGILVYVGCARGGSEIERYFDVPEGEATSTLKEAAKQADVEIIFSSRAVRDRMTVSIRGDYIPSVAFDRMLSDPNLVVVRHEQSGVYAIKQLRIE